MHASRWHRRQVYNPTTSSVAHTSHTKIVFVSVTPLRLIVSPLGGYSRVPSPIGCPADSTNGSHPHLVCFLSNQCHHCLV